MMTMMYNQQQQLVLYPASQFGHLSQQQLQNLQQSGLVWMEKKSQFWLARPRLVGGMNNPAAAFNNPWSSQDQQPERCWHSDPSFRPLPHQKIQRVQAVATDINTVLQAYAHCPVADCDIVSIDLLYNSSLEDAFRARLDLLEAQHNNSAFAPKWNQEPNAQWRAQIMGMFNQLCAPYTDPDFENVRLLPAWHGCSPDKLNGILNGGYEALATTDAGFFGVARYFTPDAEYAHRVYSKGGALIMNWVSCGSAYPVVGGDMPQIPSQPIILPNGDIENPFSKPQPNGDMVHLFAKGHYQNYDVHFAPVIPHPQDPSREWCYPVKPNELPVYSELAVFQSAQVLPRYVVELRRRTIPLSLAPPQVYAAMLGFFRPGTKTTVETYVAALQNQGAFQSLCGAASQEKQRRQIENEKVEIKIIVQGRVIAPNELFVLDSNPLGVGAFGAVYKESWQGHLVAVKVLKKQNDERLKHKFIQEAGLMFDLRHPNIVQIFGVVEHPACIVMELMANGHLRWMLQQSTNVDWTWKWRWAYQVASGLQYLHSKGILHRDLKCENVFLDGSWVAKLGDFGLATSKSVSQSTMGVQTNNPVGTAPWMAPELLNVFRGTVRYSRYTDIYAFGMVLYEILTHMLPWERELNGLPLNQLTTVANMGILQRQRPSLIGIEDPRDFVELIEKSWVQNAGDRQRLDMSIATIRRYVGDAPQSVNKEVEEAIKKAEEAIKQAEEEKNRAEEEKKKAAEAIKTAEEVTKKAEAESNQAKKQAEEVKLQMEDMRKQMENLMLQLQQQRHHHPDIATVSLVDTFIIDSREITFSSKIAVGRFGEVSKGKWRGSNVAIKRLLMNNDAISKDATEEIKKEAKLMIELRSDYVVALRGISVIEDRWCLLTEWMDRGSLYDILHYSFDYQDIAWKTRYQMALDAARGLAYLHECKILHRDMKSLNVLVNGEWRAKLCDFGMSTAKLETATKMTTSAAASSQQGGVGGGSLRWMAPELLDLRPHSSATDVFGLGVVFWEIASRLVPYERADDSTIKDELKQGQREEIPSGCPSYFGNLISRCWSQDPSHRPSAQEVVGLLEAWDVFDYPAGHPNWEEIQGSQNKLQWIKLINSSNSSFESAALNEGGGAHRFVMELFGNPSTIYVTRVEAVRNGELISRFGQFGKSKEESKMHGGEIFNIRFHHDGEKEIVFEQRMKPHFIKNTGYKKAHMLYGWSSCSLEAARSICARGCQDLRRTDGGYFGAGVYLTLQSEYAAGYSTRTWNEGWNQGGLRCIAGAGRNQVEDKEYAMVFCEICVGNVYPISRRTDYAAGKNYSEFFCYEDMTQTLPGGQAVVMNDLNGKPIQKRADKAMKAGFDCHFISVSARAGWQAAETLDEGQEGQICDEIVVKDSAQVVPLAIVYFRPKYPKQ